MFQLYHKNETIARRKRKNIRLTHLLRRGLAAVRFLSEKRIENRFVVHANVIYWQPNIEYMPEKYQSFMETVHRNHVVFENRFLRLSPKDLAIFNGPSCSRRTKDAEIGTLDVAYFYSESV